MTKKDWSLNETECSNTLLLPLIPPHPALPAGRQALPLRGERSSGKVKMHLHLDETIKR